MATIYVMFLYMASLSLMAFVVPDKAHYIYSLTSDENRSKSSWQFVAFFIFENYTKAATTLLQGVDMVVIYGVLLPVEFWLEFIRWAD